MKLSDFRNLDSSNVASWPLGVKLTVAALVVVLIAVGGWYFKVSAQQEQLERVVQQEHQLRRDFETKQGRVVNLEAYREQLAAMDDMFQQMVRQLPNRTEMPELLVDISQSALAAGIDTRLFEPGAETPRDFYAEMPINVRMVGTYHQFGDFISRVASLSRVVVLDLSNVVLEGQAQSGARRGAAAGPRSGETLRLEGVVKTYRYLDADEQVDAAGSQPGGR